MKYIDAIGQAIVAMSVKMIQFNLHQAWDSNTSIDSNMTNVPTDKWSCQPYFVVPPNVRSSEGRAADESDQCACVDLRLFHVTGTVGTLSVARTQLFSLLFLYFCAAIQNTASLFLVQETILSFIEPNSYVFERSRTVSLLSHQFVRSELMGVLRAFRVEIAMVNACYWTSLH